MKYILNYHTQEEVEQRESVSQVSSEFTHEVTTYYKGEDFFQVDSDKLVLMQGGWDGPNVINLDNHVDLVDYHSPTVMGNVYLFQPVLWRDPDTGNIRYSTLVKFEKTREEPVLIHYYTGGGRYSTKYAAEGRATLDNGEVYERTYLARGGDTSLILERFEREDGGDIYTNGLYFEANYTYYPVEVDGWKVTSVKPGVAYCKENGDVLYNGKWEGVTLVFAGTSMQKHYDGNFITREQMKDDFGLSHQPYVYTDQADDYYELYTSDMYKTGYVFLKRASGKTFTITDMG